MSKRSGVGRPTASSRASSGTSSSRAGASSSRLRIALAKACWNVRPIAIASPTLFMWVERRASAPANFSKANRGHFTTT
jgi:hypothetical protein